MKTYAAKSLAGVCLIMVGMLACGDAHAIFPKLKSWRIWPGRWPDTIIVTGNYAKARLLAEAAQRKTNLPIILISNEADGEKLFYMPHKPEARELSPEKYVEYIEFMLRPKRIIFLGDSPYVPARYIDCVRGNYPTIVLSGKDWVRNGQQLGKILGSWTLARYYEKNLKQLMEAEAHQVSMSGPSLPMAGGIPCAP